MLSLIAIFAAPYVTDRQIGGEIGQVQGILMSYWLYIHVTMVTASYSLIGMGFLLSSWWLARYYFGGGRGGGGWAGIISGDAGFVQSGGVAAGVLDAGGGDHFWGDLGGSELGQAVGVGSEGDVCAGDVDGLSDRGACAGGDGG